MASENRHQTERDVVRSTKLKGHQGSVLCLDYNRGNSSYGCLLSGSEDCTARLWDLRERLRASLCVKTPSVDVVSVAFGEGHNTTSSSVGPFARDFSIYLSYSNAIWEYDLRFATAPVLEASKWSNSSSTHTTPFESVMSADDEINQVVLHKGRQQHTVVAAADDNGCLHVWKPQFGCQTVELPNTLLTTVGFRPHTPKSCQLATGSTDGCIRLWDAGKKLKLLDTADMNSMTSSEGNQLFNPPMVHHLSYSPSGRLLAAALGDGSIALVKTEVRSFGPTKRLWDSHSGAVANVVFGSWSTTSSRLDANDRLLCSAGNDGAIVMWDLGTSLCGRHAPLEQQLQRLQLDDDPPQGDENDAEPRTLFMVQHGAKPNWMVSSRSDDPPFPSTLFIGDTTNDITAYTMPLTG